MSDLIPFTYGDRHVRVLDRDGDPWFVAADVTAVLGYSNGRAAVDQHVPARHRDSVAIHDGTPGNPNRAIVSEGGLYRLVMRSNALNAEPFQDWVTDEVLPALRKTGRYEVAALDEIEVARRYLAALESKKELERRVEELEPSAAAWDTLADTGADYSARDAAYILNRDPNISTGQNRLMDLLRAWGLIGLDGRPYATHAAHVVLRPQTRWDAERQERVPARPQVRVTVAGLRYLHKRLGGAVPLNLDKDVA